MNQSLLKFSVCADKSSFPITVSLHDKDLRVVDEAVGNRCVNGGNNQARLTVINVIPHVVDPHLSDAVNHHKQKLESFIEPYRNRMTIQTDVLVGTIFLEVIRSALRNEYY